MKLVLHNYWRSSASHRVRIGLGLKKLPYEYVAVNIISKGQFVDAYRAKNPMSQVPTLEITEDDGTRYAIPQSMPILEYLEEGWPEVPLLPRDRYLRARARGLAEIVNSGIQPLQNLSTTNKVKELGGDEGAWAKHFIGNGLAAFARAASETAGAFCVGTAEVSANWLATSPWARGISVALSGWTKFATLIVAPLWLTYPGPVRRPRPALAFAAGFLVATVAAFSILLLDGHPVQAAQTFYERTLKTQINRESPFSLWDWAQYHARGLPDLHVVQRILEGLLVLGALVAAFLPRTKTPLQLAALTGALLIGFEIVLTHWFYLYIPWFFPFVVFALLWNGPEQPEAGV